MPVQGLAANYLDIFMDAGEVRDDSGQIPLEVKPQGQEIGYHDDAGGAGLVEGGDGGGEVGYAAFEESRLPQVEATALRGGAAHMSDGFVGGFDRGPVGEENDAGSLR